MKRLRQKFTVFCLSISLLFGGLFSVSASAEEALYQGPDIFAKTYCVIDGNTGEVLMEKDKDVHMFPASTTKILTALLVLENVEDLSQELTFTETAINIDPSSSTLDPKAMIGETMTVKDALYGMLLKSANECGAMLGEFVAGSEEAFAELMNQKAQEIGAVNSHFMNAYGIHDPEHYTTAYDLCLILQAAMQNERYRELNGTLSYTIPATNMCGARTFPMGHAMLNGSYSVESEGVIGGKTGSTPQAGKVLATATERNGFYTISTLMGSDAENMYADEAVLQEFTYGIHDRIIPPVEWVETNDEVRTTTGVRVRNAPTQKAGIAGTVYEGETLKRLGIYESWSKVEFNGRECFIASELLNSLEPEKVPETESYVWPEPETEPETTEETTTETESTETAAPESSTEPETASETEAERSTPEKTGMSEKELTAFLETILPLALIAVLLLIWLLLYISHLKKKKKILKKYKD